MKSKLIGLVILLVVILAAGGYMLLSSNTAITELYGYLGGEKIGLYEDEAIQKILKDDYSLVLHYKKAGSLDMITLDHTGIDYLFPSSQTALDLYKKQLGSPLKSEIIFNTPIVLYSYRIVADAFMDEGLLTVTDGVYYMDMQRLAAYIIDGKSWSDIGLDALYGDITVSTTDPTKYRRLQCGVRHCHIQCRWNCSGHHEGYPRAGFRRHGQDCRRAHRAGEIV